MTMTKVLDITNLVFHTPKTISSFCASNVLEAAPTANVNSFPTVLVKILLVDLAKPTTSNVRNGDRKVLQ